MMQWCYDENRADFRPALPGEIEADPDALPPDGDEAGRHLQAAESRLDRLDARRQ